MKHKINPLGFQEIINWLVDNRLHLTEKTVMGYLDSAEYLFNDPHIKQPAITISADWSKSGQWEHLKLLDIYFDDDKMNVTEENDHDHDN